MLLKLDLKVTPIHVIQTMSQSVMSRSEPKSSVHSADAQQIVLLLLKGTDALL